MISSIDPDKIPTIKERELKRIESVLESIDKSFTSVAEAVQRFSLDADLIPIYEMLFQDQFSKPLFRQFIRFLLNYNYLIQGSVHKVELIVGDLFKLSDTIEAYQSINKSILITNDQDLAAIDWSLQQPECKEVKCDVVHLCYSNPESITDKEVSQLATIMKYMSKLHIISRAEKFQILLLALIKAKQATNWESKLNEVIFSGPLAKDVPSLNFIKNSCELVLPDEKSSEMHPEMKIFIDEDNGFSINITATKQPLHLLQVSSQQSIYQQKINNIIEVLPKFGNKQVRLIKGAYQGELLEDEKITELDLSRSTFSKDIAEKFKILLTKLTNLKTLTLLNLKYVDDSAREIVQNTLTNIYHLKINLNDNDESSDNDNEDDSDDASEFSGSDNEDINESSKKLTEIANKIAHITRELPALLEGNKVISVFDPVDLANSYITLLSLEQEENANKLLIKGYKNKLEEYLNFIIRKNFSATTTIGRKSPILYLNSLTEQLFLIRVTNDAVTINYHQLLLRIFESQWFNLLVLSFNTSIPLENKLASCAMYFSAAQGFCRHEYIIYQQDSITGKGHFTSHQTVSGRLLPSTEHLEKILAQQMILIRHILNVAPYDEKHIKFYENFSSFITSFIFLGIALKESKIIKTTLVNFIIFLKIFNQEAQVMTPLDLFVKIKNQENLLPELLKTFSSILSEHLLSLAPQLSSDSLSRVLDFISNNNAEIARDVRHKLLLIYIDKLFTDSKGKNIFTSHYVFYRLADLSDFNLEISRDTLPEIVEIMKDISSKLMTRYNTNVVIHEERNYQSELAFLFCMLVANFTMNKYSSEQRVDTASMILAILKKIIFVETSFLLKLEKENLEEKPEKISNKDILNFVLKCKNSENAKEILTNINNFIKQSSGFFPTTSQSQLIALKDRLSHLKKSIGNLDAIKDSKLDLNYLAGSFLKDIRAFSQFFLKANNNVPSSQNASQTQQSSNRNTFSNNRNINIQININIPPTSHSAKTDQKSPRP